MLGIGILSQLITFLITKDAVISAISGIAGVISVVFCSERRVSYYVWSFIQILTYTYICWYSGLWGKLLENAFYLITGIIGIIIWIKNLDNDNLVKTKTLNTDGIVKCLITGMVGFCVLYIILVFTGGNMPFLDAFTTTLAIIAQVLMMLRYKENWVVWFIMNILCIILWSIEHNWCMVVQYIFWTGNTIYGYIEWNKSAMNFKGFNKFSDKTFKNW